MKWQTNQDRGFIQGRVAPFHGSKLHKHSAEARGLESSSQFVRRIAQTIIGEVGNN